AASRPGRTSGGRTAAREPVGRAGARMSAPGRLSLAPGVGGALAAGRPVVALESTLISHGLPYPKNVAVARASEAAVRAAGAVPATVAIAGGRVQGGLDDPAPA